MFKRIELERLPRPPNAKYSRLQSYREISPNVSKIKRTQDELAALMPRQAHNKTTACAHVRVSHRDDVLNHSPAGVAAEFDPDLDSPADSVLPSSNPSQKYMQTKNLILSSKEGYTFFIASEDKRTKMYIR